jgi:hypothetical protein
MGRKRYDYQVYYCLAKALGNIGDESGQLLNLNKALKFGQEDPDFIQFVYMDMVAILISSKQFSSASELVNISNSIKSSTASCLTASILDLHNNTVTEKTFENIEKAFLLYESDSPSKLIDVVDFIASKSEAIVKEKLIRIIQKFKYEHIKSYATACSQRIASINDLLSQMNTDADFISANVPTHMIQKYCPGLTQINLSLNAMGQLQSVLNKLTTDSYRLASLLNDLMTYLFNEIMRYYKAMLQFDADDSSLLSKPFTQKMKPSMKMQLPGNDTIIIQAPLLSGKFITLTQENVYISRPDGKSVIFGLSEFTRLTFKEINDKDVPVDVGRNFEVVNKLGKQITFTLSKGENGDLVLIDKCAYFCTDYVLQGRLANTVDLLRRLASYNTTYIYTMLGIQSALNTLQVLSSSYVDYLSGRVGTTSNSVKIDDVEFID